MSQEILLETGTNELEIVIFAVGDGAYGINVAKVECIIPAQNVTKVPNSNPNVKGITNYRGRVIPVLDLTKTLGISCDVPTDQRLFILININNCDFAVEISSVMRIKRLSWTEIEKPSDLILSQNNTPITGVVKTEEYGIILMLDFEKLLADIAPSLAMNTAKDYEGLEGKKIIIVEDSPFLIQIVNESLHKAGAYVEKFENGRLALDYLTNNSISDIHCVITDIEMPVMDGLSLTKHIKSDSRLRDIPVIIFSSIVNESLRHKGESVGADAQITKPDIDSLVELTKTIRTKGKH